MRIDITSAEGNTLVAMALATQLLRKTGHSEAEIKAMVRAVMSAPSYDAALSEITKATRGAVTFFDPRKEAAE